MLTNLVHIVAIISSILQLKKVRSCEIMSNFPHNC